ncbi:unnamed protein product [Periconia digitata]|uniref:Microbial-type PARG catalytic domain-containing protein n=1 Tax=Periconia digitata TaxID=1303443 RepID=A0A9W4UTX6_9PLEO|nr:unnamed protein product [Periconia digitata]
MHNSYYVTLPTHHSFLSSGDPFTCACAFATTMGREKQSQGLAPPSIRKEQRAKHARHIVNKVIPAILASNARARKGADGSELISDPNPADSNPSPAPSTGTKDEATPSRDPESKYIKRKGQGRRKAKGNDAIDHNQVLPARRRDRTLDGESNQLEEKNASSATIVVSAPPTAVSAPQRTFRILNTDTLAAARSLQPRFKNSRKEPNVCILNMASPLRPGGGVLAGATSQEEFLCTKTTLLPSLHETYYRLPEYGGILTRDVLVLGSASSDLPAAERYYVDAISAGMLRFPDLVGEEGEEKRLGKKDVMIVEQKMRAVLRIASSRGVRKLVLGAWGCGAYGNPVRDIAEAWRRVLDGAAGDSQPTKARKTSKSSEPVERWDSISEVVFAISNRKMAEAFCEAFDPSVEVESLHSRGEEEQEETDHVAEELRSKILEMETQLEKVWNANLKQRMDVILDGLRAQLRERESAVGVYRSDGDGEDDNDEEEEEEEEEEGSGEDGESSADGVEVSSDADDDELSGYENSDLDSRGGLPLSSKHLA